MSKKIPDNIGVMVREIRLKLGLNQREFAEIMGVRSAAISEIENSKKNPSIAFWKHFKFRYLEQKDYGTVCDPEISYKSSVIPLSAGIRMARQFMDKFPGEELDEDGMRKLANIFQKLYDSRSKDLETQIVNEMPGDIVGLAKGK